jgi:DegV family protein with EDD domain
MKKYAIVTDSTTYFTKEDFKNNGIKQVSLNIIEGDNAYRELDVENSFVYEQFDKGYKLTTSQPSPGEYLALYEDLIKEGVEKIFVLVISEPLSGTFQSAKIAKNMLDNPDMIHLFESNMAAFGNEMLLLELVKMTDQELPADEIIARIEKLMTKTGLVFTSEDLVSLIRSGRLSKAKAMIGTVLRVKPIVKMAKGKLDLLASSRTNKKALDIITKYMHEAIVEDYKKLHVRICSHNSIEFATKLKESIKEKYKNVELTFSEYIGPVFNVHLGPKGYGVSWMAE